MRSPFAIRRVGTSALLAAAVLCVAAPRAVAEISWSIPEDGGTPRDPQRIERLGDAEFRIRASFEDGDVSVLRHAVSRVDLVCRNDGDDPVTVTVHLDLSNDGKRTDYDTKPETGMPLRDFAFIQSSGGEWQQIEGTTDKWVATISFEATPGDTKFGLSPWCTYGDYLKFIHALPDHPHLIKSPRRSDGGREHWELSITDPSTPAASKRVIFWQAREHAYETFSSFAMEGLVEFLLSDDATKFRKHYVIVLDPMTNVEGVAQGFEYRGGYDFPDPRGTSTGRVTFETVDRLHPDFCVAWHNWVMPRDENVLFYTDDDGGQATPRAWLRMTQLFPSLHRFGHRWRHETTLLKHNWFEKPNLSDANVHQYAMKRYGTRVWGWEMPWWNCSVDDARRAGADFGRAFLTTLDETHAGKVPAAVERPLEKAARWDMHEFAVHGRANVDNPYRDAALVGHFTSPTGAVKIVDGFFDGAGAWKLRIAFDEEGEWAYFLRGEGVEILEQGKLQCTPAKGCGFVRIHKENPYAFAYDDGEPFFPMGDTCYGLFDDSPITPELRQQYLTTRRSQHFNFVRMTVGHSQTRAAADPDYWAWGGNSKEPDLDRFNPEFFRRFDELVVQMRDAGMNIELILVNFYRRPFTDTAIWTPERERQWLRYVLARYGAFDNILLWTLANEYETHPDGKYRLDRPGDIAWAKATARFVKANDPHRHLVTVHPVMSAGTRGVSPRDGTDGPWRIGEFFGDEPAIDVISQQTGQMEGGARWDETLQAWEGDSSTLVESIAADRRYGKPVLNSENGYERLAGDPTSKRQVHATDKVRRTSWRIACAGGYLAAGFHGTLGHSDAWNRLDAPNHYEFRVADGGAAKQLGYLFEFFAALPYERMQPFDGVTGDAVALAEKRMTYVVYLPHGGACELDLSDALGEFTASWFDPRTNRMLALLIAVESRKQRFEAPGDRDWVLLVKRGKSLPAQ